MIELKPCPFCGGKANFNYNIALEPDGVFCPYCHMLVRFPRIRAQGNEPFEVAMTKIAEAWNRRTL